MKAEDLKNVEPGGPWLVFVDDRPPTLEEAQAYVGGYVEIALEWADAQALVNEDGLPLNLPLNKLASRVLGMLIVGNVLILTGKARWT